MPYGDTLRAGIVGDAPYPTYQTSSLKVLTQPKFNGASDRDLHLPFQQQFYPRFAHGLRNPDPFAHDYLDPTIAWIPRVNTSATAASTRADVPDEVILSCLRS